MANGLGNIRTCSFWRFWQTVAIILFLVMLLAPYPRRFTSYVMGFSLGIAVAHRLLLPARSKNNAALHYALPFFALYLVLFVSCFFADNPSPAFAFCGKHFILILIPLVFIGMGPEFFTGRRLRLFAYAFIAGAVLDVLWKAGVYLFTYTHTGILLPYREQGFRKAIAVFYTFAPLWTKRYCLLHPAFEALFLNAALALILQAMIKRDSFFSFWHGRLTAMACTLLISSNLLLFCTKTAMAGCLITFTIFALYAVLKKQYTFPSIFAVFLFIGCIMAKPILNGTLGQKFDATGRAVTALLSRNGRIQNDGSLLPRLCSYQTGWEMFLEKPVIGWGPAYQKDFKRKYENRYKEILQRRTGPELKFLSHSHNQFLAIMDAYGMVGLAVFLWLFVCIVREVRRGKSLFWWMWLAGLLVICTIDVLFNRIVGFVYLEAFYGILFCKNHAKLS